MMNTEGLLLEICLHGVLEQTSCFIELGQHKNTKYAIICM